jgi:uncharacterized protein (DUF58 family)
VRAAIARPARPWAPIPSSLAVVGGWWLVAHSSGQGWVQALGDVVAGGLLVGLLGPWLALRAIKVELEEAPSDAVAGTALLIRVRTNRPARLTALSPSGPARTAGALTVIPATRGVVHSLVVEVATAAPFGIQWWRRHIDLPLANPLFVAPRRGPAEVAAQAVPDEGADLQGGHRRSGPDGDLRAPRPYRPGDSRRLVHWPASAHAGELMVRELERPLGPPFELVVTLPSDPVEAEAAAGRALGTVLALLDRDVPVVLTTGEEGGLRRALVRDQTDAARRLAAAV